MIEFVAVQDSRKNFRFQQCRDPNSWCPVDAGEAPINWLDEQLASLCDSTVPLPIVLTGFSRCIPCALRFLSFAGLISIFREEFRRTIWKNVA